MLRGEIWWVNFDPSVGADVKKRRPAIIVSNNTANSYLNRVQVIPLTSNVSKLYPCEVLVDFNGVKSKAMADQLTTVSKLRVVNRAGEITHYEIKNIEKAIKLQLAL